VEQLEVSSQHSGCPDTPERRETPYYSAVDDQLVFPSELMTSPVYETCSVRVCYRENF